jgi:thiol-disulfide isomerase/thioredoxin
MTPRRPIIVRLGLALPGLLLAATLAVQAASPPYDEAADAKAQLRSGLAEAGTAHVPLLIVFGANWCKDCRALDAAMKTGRTASLMAGQFRVVKVDVGNFDRNQDLVAAYGQPTKGGIPAAVIVSPDNRVLYATKGGELADARHMSETGIYDFFHQAALAHAGAAVTGH